MWCGLEFTMPCRSFASQLNKYAVPSILPQQLLRCLTRRVFSLAPHSACVVFLQAIWHDSFYARHVHSASYQRPQSVVHIHDDVDAHNHTHCPARVDCARRTKRCALVCLKVEGRLCDSCMFAQFPRRFVPTSGPVSRSTALAFNR